MWQGWAPAAAKKGGMTRRELLGMAMAAAAASGAGDTAVRPPFRTRGVYFHDGFTCEPRAQAPLYWDLQTWDRELRWLHACGVNAVEFATMLEFNRLPSTELERRKIADRLKLMDRAHAAGMQFGYLLSNTVVSKVPAGEEPGHQLLDRAENLCPRVPGNFEKSMAVQSFYLDTYREADFFEEFAADWGACMCGQCGVPEYLRYVRALAEELAQKNPRATLYADTWCISYWGKDLMPQGWRAVFDREIAGTREVIAALPGLPANVGLAMPCHHLYRQLAFDSYGGKRHTPVFPTAADLDQVRKARRPLLAWPHFVMDDDPARAPAWGIVHSEARYVQALLRALRAAGIDSVMGNLYLPILQLPNAFAFGRLTEDPDREADAVLAEFARLVARHEDADALAEVMAWVENNSHWHRQMPADGRLPSLPCSLDAARAATLAAQVRPHPSPALPLPISAADWLAELRRSIGRMQEWAPLV
jgi:hypothetical protein